MKLMDKPLPPLVLFVLTLIPGKIQASPAPTAATAPATRSSLDASVINSTTPRGAVKAMRAALEGNDASTLAGLIWAPDEASQRLASACASVIVAGKRVADVAAERFGRSSGGPIARGAVGALDEDLRAIDETTLSEAGDVASIRLPGGREGEPGSGAGSGGDRVLTLRRRASDGRWFADVLAFAGLNAQVADQGSAPRRLEPREVEARVDLLYRLSAGLREVADDAAAGRYRSAADVRAAVQDRFHGAVAKSLEAMEATTRPSTRNSPAGTTHPAR
jgi:hypothetical protein